MTVTQAQKMAQTASAQVTGRLDPQDRTLSQKYASFARSFPSLIHSCGLAQAVAFAEAKKQALYLEDLVAVLAKVEATGSVQALAKATREHPVVAYMRLSRHALQAAGWLKRYVEAAKESDASKSDEEP